MGRIVYDDEFKAEIKRLFNEGCTEREVSLTLGCSTRTARTYKPEGHIDKKRPGAKKGFKRGDKKFPVHPEVILAKQALLAMFSAKEFDVTTFSQSTARLTELLMKHHPPESRPPEQVLDLDQLYRMMRRIKEAA